MVDHHFISVSSLKYTTILKYRHFILLVFTSHYIPNDIHDIPSLVLPPMFGLLYLNPRCLMVET